MSRIVLIISVLLLCGCNQNIEVVNDGETLDASAKPSVQPNSKTVPEPASTRPGDVPAPPLAQGEGGGPFSGGAVPGMSEDKVPPFVKAYFMHNFVEALYSTPKNFNPNPNWSSPLKDPANGRVWCTDCHISGTVDFGRIPKQRTPMVDKYEKDKAYMVDLMKKWVGRLNSDEFLAKAKLKQPVTCLTCHATNPASGL